jgi:carbamate kinase
VARTVVIAVGGNALSPDGHGSYDEQLKYAMTVAASVAELVAHRWRVVLVHGNGPQVGALSLQQEGAVALVPAQPLFSLGAMTQGQIGSYLALALRERLGAPYHEVACVVTHVAVERDDPAFATPSKPIGPFFSAQDAKRIGSERGWTMAEDSGRGFRRVVASPEPLAVLEVGIISRLVDGGCLVVACGGGGIPVIPNSAGYTGVEAVIDKDLAAQRLAIALGAEALVLVTAVPTVQIDFGTPGERDVHELTVDQAQRHLDAGQFPAGSMGPKVLAAIRFIREGGTISVITSCERLIATLEPEAGAEPGRMGTRIVSAMTDLHAV